MNECPSSPLHRARKASARAGTTFVRADAIRGTFAATVSRLGGNPSRLMEAEGLEPDVLVRPDGMLQYRTMINLLERAAGELACPDFGLMLARHTSDALAVAGPLGIAMKNAGTLAEAFSYCARHVHVYSDAVHVSLERDGWSERNFMLFDILLDGVPHRRQVVEHALGLTCNAVKLLSDQRIKPSEVWLTHGTSGTAGYCADFFSSPVRFGMPYNALYFSRGDLEQPVVNRNQQTFHATAGIIHQNFPPSDISLSRRVRIILSRTLSHERCTQAHVADLLGMNLRTLQRRLGSEGTTFGEIADRVRREIALRNLGDTNIPLTQIAERVGYSETSVLTRSCQRWFSRSPKQMRKDLQSGKWHRQFS